MELTRWEPARLMSDLLDEVWSAPFGVRGRGYRGGSLRPFEADVVEHGDEIRVTAELPGIKRDNLDLTLENNVLTISGEKKEAREEGDENDRYHLMERRWGRFSRSFALPRTVDSDQVRADFEDGILTVRIPKTQDSRRRRIAIGGGHKQLSESGR